jgi:hypothetical protein
MSAIPPAQRLHPPPPPAATSSATSSSATAPPAGTAAGWSPASRRTPSVSGAECDPSYFTLAPKQAVDFIKAATASVMRHALDEPELISDLRDR